MRHQGTQLTSDLQAIATQPFLLVLVLRYVVQTNINHIPRVSMHVPIEIVFLAREGHEVIPLDARHQPFSDQAERGKVEGQFMRQCCWVSIASAEEYTRLSD